MEQKKDAKDDVVDITVYDLEFEDGAGPNPRIWVCDLDEGMGRFEIVRESPKDRYFAAYYKNDERSLGEEPKWFAVAKDYRKAAIKCQEEYERILKE